ncbi:MAG: class I SAM-dependent methyltransferase, partial [Candidatus Margulisbacteria bacterium]|nr:class I SAM-dependent methyltransferase [Candidatus Margulisiibacteriota bacterium]
MKQHETAEIRKAFAFEETDDNAHLSSKLGIQRYVMMADQIKKILGDGRILDWGCGAGQMSYLLKNRGLDVTSCDIRSGNRPLLEGIGQSVQQLTDQVKLPFTDASFDAVLSSGVLEHVNDQFASLKEISRILKDGGYFFVYMLPNRYSYVEFISDLLGRGDHPVKYSLKEIRGIVEQTGFEVSRMGYQNF